MWESSADSGFIMDRMRDLDTDRGEVERFALPLTFEIFPCDAHEFCVLRDFMVTTVALATELCSVQRPRTAQLLNQGLVENLTAGCV